MCLLHTQASLKLCCCLGFKSRLVRENLSRADRFSVYVQTVLALLAHSALASGHKTVLSCSSCFPGWFPLAPSDAGPSCPFHLG